MSSSQEIEKSNAYRVMMDLWAYRDLIREMKEQRQAALESSLDANEIKDVQLQKGKVRAIDEIINYIDYTVNGPK